MAYSFKNKTNEGYTCKISVQFNGERLDIIKRFFTKQNPISCEAGVFMLRQLKDIYYCQQVLSFKRDTFHKVVDCASLALIDDLKEKLRC